ncbi:MAG TPA: DNA polymerase III subunit beta [Syntrophomonadaceae bacterium]|nr:DNA polymerase III subunit beta [Syntrophomonadaceae bacterium]
MKIVCNRDELSTALISICRIIPSRTNLPILNGCLITAENQTLSLRSTDLELTLEINIPVQVEEEGSTVVLAKYFSDLVRRMSGEQVSLSYSEENKMLEVKCESAISQLHTWMAAEYPEKQENPEGQQINFQGGKWKRYTNKVLAAAAQQDVRMNYAGVYVTFENEKIQMAATDAYRLAFIRIANNSDVVDSDLFIPGRALIEVNRLASDSDNLEIFWDSGTICIEAQDFVLTSRLINSQFPNYENIIPSEPELEIEVPRDILLNTLERASLFISTNEHFAIACLKVDEDKLIVSAQAVDVGSLEEIITLSKPALKQAEANFNAKYLLEPLQVMEQEKVTLCLNGPSGPAVYVEADEDEYYLHLVSPVCRAN